MRMKWSPAVITLISTLSLGLSASPLLAHQGHEDGRHGAGPHGGKATKDSEKSAERARHAEKGPVVHPARAHAPAVPHAPAVIVFDRNGHQRIVHEYYVAHPLPPGLAQRESLPPGLSRQLRERGHLPRGLQKRLTSVPAVLVSQLPAVPPYYHRYFAGRDLVVVDGRTNTIVGVIRDVR